MANYNPIYTKAVVNEEEKKDIKRVCGELGVSEMELVRRGLKKMGVNIEIAKSVGAPEGNKNNPKGNPEFGKKDK